MKEQSTTTRSQLGTDFFAFGRWEEMLANFRHSHQKFPMLRGASILKEAFRVILAVTKVDSWLRDTSYFWSRRIRWFMREVQENSVGVPNGVVKFRVEVKISEKVAAGEL